MEYESFSSALTQADLILKEIIEINKNLSPLIYSPKKTRFIFTLLSNLYGTTGIFKTLTVGYEGEQELKARCDKYNRKYLYNVGDERYNIITINILQEISKGYCVKKFPTYLNKEKDALSNLININSYKTGRQSSDEIFYLRAESFTESEYQKYIRSL